MGFWDKVNAELKKTVEGGWEAVKGSARVGKLRLTKHNLNKKAEKRFAEIGGIVFDMAKPPWENPLSRPAVLKLIEEIKKIETEIAEIEDEIDRGRHREKAGEEEAPVPPGGEGPEEGEEKKEEKPGK